MVFQAIAVPSSLHDQHHEQSTKPIAFWLSTLATPYHVTRCLPIEKEMIGRNEEEIKSKFSSLVLEVQNALEEKGVDAEKVRLFLIRLFENDFVKPSSDFADIFTTMSTKKLWSYNHYSPVEKVTKKFLPDSESVEYLIKEYKGHYSGFCVATKLIHHVDPTEDAEDDKTETFSVKNYVKYHKKIKAVLRVPMKISDISLSYVNDLWTELAEEFELPSLTAVIDKIVTGSIEITWLVLPHLAATIILKSKFPLAVKFFRQHQIINLMVDEDVIYDENQMVSTILLAVEFNSICFSLLTD